MIAQKTDPVRVAIASGYTTKTRPGPMRVYSTYHIKISELLAEFYKYYENIINHREIAYGLMER